MEVSRDGIDERGSRLCSSDGGRKIGWFGLEQDVRLTGQAGKKSPTDHSRLPLQNLQ